MSHVTEHANADERLTGTAEWAASTLNVARGCSHGCLYCYARFNALRFGQIASGADWTNEHVHDDRVTKNYRGGRGRIMLPSSHDITLATADAVATVASKLLEAKTPAGKAETRLLLVTKADGPCIQRVVDAIDACHRHRVLWRLTIGCLDDRCRAFWEPNAPAIDMRLETLRWLARTGWQTSVSAEPLLEPRRAAELVATVAPHVTETIWIGAARELRARTAWCRNALTGDPDHAIANLEAWQTPPAIVRVAESVRSQVTAETWTKIRWKDSYAEALRRHGRNIENGRLLAESAGAAEKGTTDDSENDDSNN